MLISPLLEPARPDYRHVVFNDDVRSTRCAINLAPEEYLTSAARVRPSRTDSRLGGEESHFVHLLFRRAGLCAGDYREETLLRRLPACLRAMRVGSASEASAALEHDPRLLAAALNAMVIGVTSFFRDRTMFDSLRDRVFPMLAARRSYSGYDDLRVWSAGCSDGSELYSVAMLLDGASMLARSTLLGTDCRAAAVRAATQGAFDADAVRALPRATLERYFTPDIEPGARANDERCRRRLRPFIRQHAQWRTADALLVEEPGTWDIILCRNLAIYLKPDAARRLWERLSGRLRRGGVLILGKSECPSAGVPLRCIAPCIFRREDD